MKSTKKSGKLKSSPLNDLFVNELKDIYWAEKAITKALTKMVKAATTPELKDAFENHLEETQEQIKRLEKVFSLMDMEASGKKCEAMAGLIEESESLMEETDEKSLVRDVALIVSAQKIEHYEISSYGSLRTLAKTLGEDEVAALLQATLDEESATDEKLTSIAEASVNEEASVE